MLKLPLYARLGIQHAWIVDPTQRFIQVYSNVNGLWSIIGGYCDEEDLRVEPFDAVPLELALLWI